MIGIRLFLIPAAVKKLFRLHHFVYGVWNSYDDIDKNIDRWVNIAKRKAGIHKKTVLEITLEDDEVQIGDNVMTEQDIFLMVTRTLREDRKLISLSFPRTSREIFLQTVVNCSKIHKDQKWMRITKLTKP